MKKLLENFYIKYIEEDSNINDHNEFYEIYYLILSCKELNLDILDKNVIVNSIDNYFSKLHYNNSKEIASAIFDLRIGIEIESLLNIKISELLRKSSLEIIDKTKDNEDIYGNIIVTDINDIIMKLNDNKDINKEYYNKKILNTLNKLYSGGGYKIRIGNENGEPDVISTLEALKTKLYLGGLSKIEKTQVKNFIYSLKSKTNLFKVSPSGSEADLKNIFEALCISSYY